LSTQPPSDEARTTSEVDYDPADPVPTHGGALTFTTFGPGPVDQARIEARPDVLVSSAGLEEDVEVTGRIARTRASDDSWQHARQPDCCSPPLPHRGTRSATPLFGSRRRASCKSA
jgi:predicted acyl esterase